MKLQVSRLPADADAEETAFAAEAAGLLASAQALAASCPPPALVSAASTGVLPGELQARVAAHVESCPLCRVLAEGLDEGAEVAGPDVERLWATLTSDLSADPRGRTEGKPRRRVAWWSWRPMLATLAVAAVAVIAVGVWWARLNPPVPPDRPAVALSAVPAVSVLALDRPAVAWPDVPALLWRGGRGVSGAEEDLDVAVAAYDAGRFDRAAGRLASVLAREPGLEDARLALGVSLLHLGRSREALAAFEAIATRGDVQLADETRWYAALAALHQDDRPRAIGLLSQLCGGAGHRAAQACLGVDELTRPAPRTLRSR